MDRGCASVGSIVASDSRDPWFDSSHRQNLFSMFTFNCIEETNIKKNEARNGPFKVYFQNITN